MKRTLLTLLLLAATGTALAQGKPGPDIDKVNGAISAEARGLYGDLSTVNGAISLGDGARARDVETVNGAISAGDDVATRDVSTVNGGIRFGQRARVDGDVETVNGGIFVDRGGNVGGDISTVNGAIGLVDTDLAGGIETVNGDITVGVGSHVKGGIKVEKTTGAFGISLKPMRVPRVVIGADAVVEGPLVFQREVKLLVHERARIGAVTGASVVRYASATPPKD